RSDRVHHLLATVAGAPARPPPRGARAPGRRRLPEAEGDVVAAGRRIPRDPRPHLHRPGHACAPGAVDGDPEPGGLRHPLAVVGGAGMSGFDDMAPRIEWWLATLGRTVVWARLRVREAGTAEVLDSDGNTLIYDSEDTARAMLLDAEFVAFDG